MPVTKATFQCDECGYSGLLTIFASGSHLDHCTACMVGKRRLVPGTEKTYLTPKEKQQLKGPPVSDRLGDGGHYKIVSLGKGNDTSVSVEDLKVIFGPNGKANQMNFALFSTSGVHGSYTTIEDVETGGPKDYGDHITILICQPRLVCFRYGHVAPKSPADFAYLKALRASSHEAVAGIGL